MSASPTRRSRWPLRLAAVVLAAALLVLAGLYITARRRADALLRGAAFVFDYTVTSTAPEPSLAYSTLEALDAVEGSIAGQSSGDDLQIAWYALPAAAFQSEQAPGSEEAFTDLVAADGQVYLNVRQIYRTFLSGLNARYPIAASLIPDWGLGDYITQTQLARLLGAEPAAAGLAGYSVSAFSPGQLKRAEPADGLDGYLYFTPKQPLEGAEVTVGFPLRSLWADFFTCHVLVDLPAQGLHFELTGRALPYENAIAAPASVMRDEDIAALADIFAAVRSLAALVQELVGPAG